jgi:hypothetical protein
MRESIYTTAEQRLAAGDDFDMGTAGVHPESGQDTARAMGVVPFPDEKILIRKTNVEDQRRVRSG